MQCGHERKKKETKHTTVGIRWWSPTQLLIYRSWQSGRDARRGHEAAFPGEHPLTKLSPTIQLLLSLLSDSLAGDLGRLSPSTEVRPISLGPFELL